MFVSLLSPTPENVSLRKRGGGRSLSILFITVSQIQGDSVLKPHFDFPPW